ncbi:MAG: thioesterase [Paenibacillus sp.]|nr:thioesterase [Paenibacillus sp.]
MDGNTELWIRKLEQAAKGTFWELLGCSLVALDPEKAVIAITADARHMNHLGMLHGGVHASLLDQAMGIAAMAARPDDRVVTSGMNVHFLTPLGAGTITATAELLHQSHRTITVFAKIEDSGGTLGSWGSGSFRVLPERASP